MKTQNKNHTISEQHLEIGQKVYVKVLGLALPKLDPKYRGPFTIVDRTSKGNYILENVLKERMADTYPLQLLKLVVEEDDLRR